MLRDLRDAWATIAMQQRKAASAGAAGAALNARG
jgi:hypothetical protein